jgi:DNA invertase Pin-like site-specific DNA recombinase
MPMHQDFCQLRWLTLGDAPINTLARAEKLRPGDTLVLAEWDRATRSMWDGLHIVKQVIDAGATIKVLDFPSLDLATPEARGFLAMFSAMAERERARIIERTREVAVGPCAGV